MPNTEELQMPLETAERHLLSATEEQVLGKQIQKWMQQKENIKKHPEDLRLQRIAREGKEAEDTFILSNIGLVKSIAQQYVGLGLEFEDLVQNGILGLITATKKFDYSRGYKFSTYATWWIRQSITRQLTDTGKTIRVPVHAMETIMTLKRMQTEYYNKHNCYMTDSQVQDVMGIDEDKLKLLQRAMQDPASLNEQVGDDSFTELGDMIPDERETQPETEGSAVHEALHEDLMALMNRTLTHREKEILCMRYGMSDRDGRMTLAQIAEIYHVSRERIRQIESKALQKLKKSRSGRHLKAYLR